ncbi:MAG: riboflavin biosynthesis protein RibF [Clostridiales bacterium]|nr:riboflavin biosynthesis protein RibF [Candidatus Blautia equi]
MDFMRVNGEFPVLLNCAVTLGKFDGVHRGHKKLIDAILNRKCLGEKAVVVAFVSGKPALLTSEERMHYLEELGIDLLIECPLTPEFCAISAEDFVKSILVEKLDTRFVAVGEDYMFGRGRAGDVKLLSRMGEEYGFLTEIVEKEMYGDRKVSSTFIREELAVGHMEMVECLLGRPFVVEGFVEHGRGMGKRDFFPTANLVPSPNKLLPPNGVYASRSFIKDHAMEGISNIGYKPTVGENFVGLETYLFNCEEELYGEFCKVQLLKYQRPEKKFESFEALKEQISSDIQDVKIFFAR